MCVLLVVVEERGVDSIATSEFILSSATTTTTAGLNDIWALAVSNYRY